MSQLGALLGGIAAVLWVLLAIAIAYKLRGVLAERWPFMTKLGLSTSGVSMEFAAARLDEAAASSTEGGREIGEAAKRGVLERLERNADLLRRCRILWVDDHPENNAPVTALLRQFGARVDERRTNDEALGLLRGTRYDVVMSDVARDDEGPKSDLMGVELARHVFERYGQQVILFSARFNPATFPGLTADERLVLVREVDRDVFGITNYFDEALHLALDVLERQE